MQKLPDFVDNAIKNVTDNPTKEIGKLIKDAIYLKFGSTSYNAEKRRILEKYGLIEFEHRLELCMKKIPFENLAAPDYQTLMLSIDNLEPCINSEELRNIFANLISRSCDSNYKEMIHPSIPEAIKQMSPYDAKVLKFFTDTKPERLITYTYYNDHKYKGFDRIPYTFDTYPNQYEASYVSVSVSSLMRLGILAFDDDALVHPADDSPFKESNFYKHCEAERINEGKYSHSCITGKLCVLTPFGSAFIRACFD